MKKRGRIKEESRRDERKGNRWGEEGKEKREEGKRMRQIGGEIEDRKRKRIKGKGRRTGE